MPYSHILHVFSVPEKVDEALWAKYYVTEHIPDMVKCGVSKTARGYRIVDNPLQMPPCPEQRPFLAVYGSDNPTQLFCKEYLKDVRHDSSLWEEGQNARMIGQFDIRNYGLMEEYNPKTVEEKASTYLLHFEINPRDEAEMMDWAKTELQEQLQSLPGFRRSLYYRGGYMDHGSPGPDTPPFVMLFDFDSFDGVSKAIIETGKAKSVIDKASVFNTRAYKLFAAEPAEFRPQGHQQEAYNPIPEGHKNPPLPDEVIAFARSFGIDV